MVNLIEDGWLYLSNGTDVLELACKKIQWDEIRDPNFNHQPGFNFVYDLDVDYFIVKVTNVYFNTTAKYELAVATLNAWQKAGIYNLKIQRNVAGAYLKLDGIYTQIQVMMNKGLSNMEKISPEDGEVYTIGKITFEEGGVRS
jgi:hypothetical protein